MNDDNSQQNYYFRIDEKSNTFDSLQKTAVFLEKVEEEPFYWKWAMIALHNAFYGSMILSLQGSNPARVNENFGRRDVED